MTVPRLLSPLVRTRARLICTMGLLLAMLAAVALPWWRDGKDEPRAPRGEAGEVSTVPLDEATARTAAAHTGKDVLVDKATTATSLTWARPDGQLRTQVHAVPQRARTPQGRWERLDTALSRVDDTPGSLGVRPGNVTVPVRFATGGTTTQESVLAETDVDGHTITYTWPGPLPEPVLDGARALYPEVRPGVDLLLVAREEGGFGQVLIVKTRAAATNNDVRSLNYGLRSPQAVFRRDATTGGVKILNPKTGAELGSIPTPFAWDSSARDPESSGAPRTSVATSADVLQLSGLSGIEPGSRSAPMPTRLDGDNTGNARLHLDAAATGLLTARDVHYPVFLDPDINSGEQAWIFVRKQNPNSNFLNGKGYNKNGTTEARVGYEEDTKGLTRSFWRMGYKNIKGAQVTSAAFKVNNHYSWSCTKREFQLWATGAISSGTTWNKQPAWTALQQKLVFAHGYGSCKDEYVSFNVRDAAQRGADAAATSITLGMKASSEADSQTWRKFQANSATLEVIYNRKPNEPTGLATKPGGACVPAPGTRTLAKGNIVLLASAVDADKNLKDLLFRFWKAGTPVPKEGKPATVDSTGKASLTIPTTTLADKTAYLWDVTARDAANAVSSAAPAGTQPCQITIDASAPPAPDVESDVFPEATADGATWATVKFGGTGAVTFTSTGSVRFEYSLNGLLPQPVTATAGVGTVPALKPRHSGPQTLQVVGFDAVGNPSPTTHYYFYVPPRDAADGPGDTGGDGIVDLVVVDAAGNLRTLPGDAGGDLHASLDAAYSTGNKLRPTGHWTNATGQAALIAKHSDVYPGDGTTDLFARTPDGGFWLYPGDGYGSFNVDQRLKVLLPSNAPAPSDWTQIKAVGDVTGDKLPDLFLRAGSAFWALTGYTGGSFQQAIRMDGAAWARQEIVNVADVDLDGTPDLVWRHLDTGIMNLRHGKPGTVAGSVNLDSLKTAAAARQGDVKYGAGWTEKAITAVVGIPDVNGDKVPDIWVRTASDGQFRVYHPSTTDTKGAVKVVQPINYATIKAFA